jgi:hypothetical protein
MNFYYQNILQSYCAFFFFFPPAFYVVAVVGIWFWGWLRPLAVAVGVAVEGFWFMPTFDYILPDFIAGYTTTCFVGCYTFLIGDVFV